MSHAGISFEADMTDEQAAELARLMEEGRATRPEVSSPRCSSTSTGTAG